ncbi:MULTISPECIES: helix-turn-helix domain-containing protein [Streptosporangium]|uniref:Transcriptional regulator with XRE-family HTH domain n=1 Tax=Streptosporangium brasiliense TaxID=47480 RepID=A0ABT9R8Z3_9ACTN|nr:helix-turn-helix domain-containing protein [Streptosporangium brasiliense]MDP9864880.1 transcriptional regulator with XRE-family HTH domain [Streptosporangium brasiliense]
MIQNERQYRITARQRQVLAEALEQLHAARADTLRDPSHVDDGHDLLRFQLEEASLDGQIIGLDDQLREYEELRAGGVERVRVTSLSDFPQALIKARIASGLSQRDLAHLLGLKEQQIQRYENEGYKSASLTRLEEVRRALNVELDAGIQLPAIESPLRRLKQRLLGLKLDRKVVEGRLLRDIGDKASPAAVLGVAERAARLLGLQVEQLLAPADTALPPLATTARFKAPANAEPQKLDAYTRYAEGLAEIVLKATKQMGAPRPPADARAARAGIDKLLRAQVGAQHDEDGPVNKMSSGQLYEATLRYLFHLGIPVIALRDPGTFHGACFTAGGRSILIMKQTTDSMAKWLHDLLHELPHLSDPSRGELRSWYELGDVSTWSDDPEEQRANAFAADVLFQGRGEAVIERCFLLAGGSIERLKRAVPAVAQEAEVPVDVLANYVAFQLSTRGINWWGVATSFQVAGTPWRTATDLLLEHLDFTALDSIERAALMDALAA